MLKKFQEDKVTGVCVLPNWPTQAWFPKAMKMMVQEPVVLQASKTLLHLPNLPTALHPLHKKLTLLNCLPLIRTHLNNKEISTTAKDFIMASWSASTAKHQIIHLSRWETFDKSRNINKFSAIIENGIDFLASLYEKGLGYSATNTARSALSSVLDLPGAILLVLIRL